MASSVLALPSRPRQADSGAPRARVTLQRPFHSPDQRGGSIEMWSNVAVLDVVTGSEPPRDVWPVEEGEFGRWLLLAPLDGVRRGFRVLLAGETWIIDQVCYVELPERRLWLRLVRG
jgi:hypothetical protein